MDIIIIDLIANILLWIVRVHKKFYVDFIKRKHIKHFQF